MNLVPLEEWKELLNKVDALSDQQQICILNYLIGYLHREPDFFSSLLKAHNSLTGS